MSHVAVVLPGCHRLDERQLGHAMASASEIASDLSCVRAQVADRFMPVGRHNRRLELPRRQQQPRQQLRVFPSVFTSIPAVCRRMCRAEPVGQPNMRLAPSEATQPSRFTTSLLSPLNRERRSSLLVLMCTLARRTPRRSMR